MPNRKQSAMEKPKNFGASIAFVWSYLRRRKPLLFLAGLMVLFNIGATLAGTAMLQPIIDNFLEPVRALSVSERFAGLLQGIRRAFAGHSQGMHKRYGIDKNQK